MGGSVFVVFLSTLVTSWVKSMGEWKSFVDLHLGTFARRFLEFAALFEHGIQRSVRGRDVLCAKQGNNSLRRQIQ